MHLTPWLPTVVVAMPCYEEEGIVEFIDEIESHLRPLVRSLQFVVVDDCSPSVPPRAVLEERHASTVRVESNVRNLGHGPTVMSAYAHALAEGSDVVIHVDGDGQFHGADFPRLLSGLQSVDVVVGERTGRTDPWFRRSLTGLLSQFLRGWCGEVRDVNSPLRAYRSDALGQVYRHVSPVSCVPHVLLTVRMKDIGLRVATVTVQSRPRRGETEVGTTWSSTAFPRVLPPRTLVRLCSSAAREVFWCLARPRQRVAETEVPAPIAA